MSFASGHWRLGSISHFPFDGIHVVDESSAEAVTHTNAEGVLRKRVRLSRLRNGQNPTSPVPPDEDAPASCAD